MNRNQEPGVRNHWLTRRRDCMRPPRLSSGLSGLSGMSGMCGSVTIPAAPTITLITGGTGQIVLTCSAPGATSCNILISSDGGATYPQTITGAGTTTYTDASAIANVQASSGKVFYKAQAVNSAGTSASSAPANASPWVADDTFTDTDGVSLASHTMNVGAGWSIHGTATIQSNKGSVSGSAPTSPGYWLGFVDTGKSDATVSLDVTIAAAGSAGVAFRFTDNSNNYLAILDIPSGKFTLYEVAAGTSTQRAQTSFASSAGPTYTIKAVFSGNSITCTVNGGNAITYSSSDYATNTKHGYYQGAPGGTIDNFTVTSP